MSESEAEIKHATGEETAKATKQATEKPKTAKVSKPETAAKVEEKKTASIEGIMTTIKNMTVLELSQLIKAMEAEFGVSAAVPAVATTAAPATEAAAPATAEEKTEFSVILKAIGANKISVIKAVREVTTLGLKEAKDLVEGAPTAVREGVSKEEVSTIKQKLEDAGATVEVK